MLLLKLHQFVKLWNSSRKSKKSVLLPNDFQYLQFQDNDNENNTNRSQAQALPQGAAGCRGAGNIRAVRRMRAAGTGTRAALRTGGTI